MGILDGKVALITGAGSGMAKASTNVFVRDGAKVVAGDISGAEKDTAAEVGEGVLPVVGVTKSAAIELGPRGIRVNCICPGFILTEIMGAAGAASRPDMFTKAALGRAGEPHEVAEVAAFLASDRASFVSGAIVPEDGGWTAKLA